MPKTKGSAALAETADDKHHKYRCRDLKRQLEELEEYNEMLAIKLLKSQKRLRRMRIERNILLERFEQTRRYDHHHDNDDSASDSDAPLKNTFPHNPASDIDASEPSYRSANVAATPTTASSRGRRRAGNGTAGPNPSRSNAGTPQPQSANGSATHDTSAANQPQTSTRKPRAEKDPLAPRRPANAFVLYCQVERPNIRSKGTDLTYTEMTKAMGVKWKNLSQEEKKKYFDMYEREMFRYQQELETYKGGGGTSGSAVGSGGNGRAAHKNGDLSTAAATDSPRSADKHSDKDINEDVDAEEEEDSDADADVNANADINAGAEAYADADAGANDDLDGEPSSNDVPTSAGNSVVPSSARSETTSAMTRSESSDEYTGIVRATSQNSDMDVDHEGSLADDHNDGDIGISSNSREPGSTAETVVVVANDDSDKERIAVTPNGIVKDEADTVTSSPAAANGAANGHEDRMSVDGRDESAAVVVSSPHKPAASSVPAASPVGQLL